MGEGFEQSASLRNFIVIMFKHKWIVLSVFVIIVMTVTIGSFVLPPIFEASAKILVEQKIDFQKALLFRMNIAPGYEDYNWIDSEIEIITSYPVAVSVVKSLKLDQLKYKKKPSSEQEKTKQFEEAVNNLKNKLNIKKVKDSNVILISYEGTDPKLITSIVNKVIDSYLEYRSEISKSMNYDFFDQQIIITDERIRKLEEHQVEFKKQREVISPEGQEQILLTRLADYEKNLTAFQTNRIGKEAKLAVIKEKLEQGQELSIPAIEVSDSPSREKYISKLKGDLLDMELQREQLLQKFTPKYEEIVNLEQQIAATNSKFKDEIWQIIDMEETSIRALKAEENVFQKAIAEIKKEIQEFAQKEYEYEQISRGIDDNKDVYSMLLKQREEARISLAKSEQDISIKIISPATVSIEPIKPRKTVNFVMAIFLGILVGCSTALLVNYFSNTIHIVMELEKILKLPDSGDTHEIKRKQLTSPRPPRKRLKAP